MPLQDFANIDCFDIERTTRLPRNTGRLSSALLSRPSAAINLEDHQAPDCFIMNKFPERMNIPRFPR